MKQLPKDINEQILILNKINNSRNNGKDGYNKHRKSNNIKVLGSILGRLRVEIIPPVNEKQNQKDGKHLGGGFPFCQYVGNYGFTNVEGKYPVEGDDDIPNNDDPDHPGKDIVEYGKGN